MHSNFPGDIVEQSTDTGCKKWVRRASEREGSRNGGNRQAFRFFSVESICIRLCLPLDSSEQRLAWLPSAETRFVSSYDVRGCTRKWKMHLFSAHTHTHTRSHTVRKELFSFPFQSVFDFSRQSTNKHSVEEQKQLTSSETLLKLSAATMLVNNTFTGSAGERVCVRALEETCIIFLSAENASQFTFCYLAFRPPNSQITSPFGASIATRFTRK